MSGEEGASCGGNCGRGLGEDAVVALGKAWHMECFKCVECREELKEAFVERETRPFCLSCHAKAFNPSCNACGLRLGPEDGAVTADDEHFHPACLLCHLCKKPLSKAYYLFGSYRCHLACHWTLRLRAIANPSTQ